MLQKKVSQHDELEPNLKKSSTETEFFLRLVGETTRQQLAVSKPHIPFLWSIFLRLGSSSSSLTIDAGALDSHRPLRTTSEILWTFSIASYKQDRRIINDLNDIHEIVTDHL